MTTLDRAYNHSLPQPVKLPAERCTDPPANSMCFGPVTSIFNTNSMCSGPLTSIFNTNSMFSGPLTSIFNTNSMFSGPLTSIFNTNSMFSGPLTSIFNTNSICSGPVTSTFSAMRFDESASAKKVTRKALGFQISQFHWPFSSDIMAVKGLIWSSRERVLLLCATDSPSSQLSALVLSSDLPR